jgi:multidrug efflux pump subunit AcrB
MALLIATLIVRSGLVRLEAFSVGLIVGLSLILRNPPLLCALRVYLLAHGAMRVTWSLSKYSVYARHEASCRRRTRRALALVLGLLAFPAPAFLILTEGERFVEYLHLDIDAYASARVVDAELQAAASALSQTLSPTFVQTQARRGSGSLSAGFQPHTDRSEIMRAVRAFNDLGRRGRLIPRADELPGNVHRVPMYATAPTSERAHEIARLAAREASGAVLHFREDSDRVVLRPRRLDAHQRGVDLGQASFLLQSIISPAVHHKRIASGRETDVRVEIRPPAAIPMDQVLSVQMESLLDTVSVSSLTGEAIGLSQALYPTRERRPDVLTHANRNPSAHFSLLVQTPSMREAIRRAERAMSRVALPDGSEIHFDSVSAASRRTRFVQPDAMLLALYALLVFLLAACVEESWRQGLRVIVYTSVLVSSLALIAGMLSHWDTMEIAGYPSVVLFSSVTVLRLLHLDGQRLRISSRCRAIRCIFR